VDELHPGMTDDEVLAFYRRRRPHISRAAATGTYRAWRQFRHLGAEAEKRRREAADAERDRLRRGLFGPQS
jgi:hypothetical protein